MVVLYHLACIIAVERGRFLVCVFLVRRIAPVPFRQVPEDPARDYRITTIDYLLGGTDKMDAFKKGRNINSPQEVSNNTRFIIMNYFRDKAKQGIAVDAKVEGRVVVEK